MRFLNHNLIGKKVLFGAEKYIVTGARKVKAEKGCRFRLLDVTEGSEFWTGNNPVLEEV